MKLSPANPPHVGENQPWQVTHISQFSRLWIINYVLYPGAYSIRKTKCKECHTLVENRHVFKLRIHFLLWMYTIWWHNLASVYTVQLQFRGMDENTEWCIQWAVQYLRDFCETQKREIFGLTTFSNGGTIVAAYPISWRISSAQPETPSVPS